MTARNETQKLIVVSGPTACGKSAFSLKLAKELNAEIVNIDSVQIYKELNIGAAKFSEKEMQGVPHHLISRISPNESCNVAAYCKLAREAIFDIQSRGMNVILTGGTTMYITCLLQGLEELPDSDKNLRDELESLSSDDLVKKLSQHDPEAVKRISKSDRIRLVRALEASILSGKPASLARSEHAKKTKADFEAVIIVLCLGREELYKRINQRARLMLDKGLLEETENLIGKYGKDIAGLKSLGYAQAAECLQGVLPRENLEETIAMLTRRFAKRQMTYWRNEPAKRGWISHPGINDAAMELKGSFKVLDWDFTKLVLELQKELAVPIDKTNLWYINASI